MDLKQFKYYIAIAEECSLVRAAEKLYVSQSSLSRYLIKLEDSLNVKLFIRLRNNSLVITKAGEELLDCYRDVVRQIEKCVDHFSEAGETGKQRIICGVTAELAIRKISSILPEFTQIYPNTKIEFKHGYSNKLIDLLNDNELDLVRCVYDEMTVSPKLKYVPIYKSSVCLFVPQNHRLASNPNATVSLKDIAEETVVMPDCNSGHRKIIQRYFDENEFTPRRIIEVPTSLSALTMIEEGLAVGLMQGDFEDSKICALKLEQSLYYNIGFIYRKDSKLPKETEDFIQMCLNTEKDTKDYDIS